MVAGLGFFFFYNFVLCKCVEALSFLYSFLPIIWAFLWFLITDQIIALEIPLISLKNYSWRLLKNYKRFLSLKGLKPCWRMKVIITNVVQTIFYFICFIKQLYLFFQEMKIKFFHDTVWWCIRSLDYNLMFPKIISSVTVWLPESGIDINKAFFH